MVKMLIVIIIIKLTIIKIINGKEEADDEICLDGRVDAITCVGKEAWIFRDQRFWIETCDSHLSIDRYGSKPVHSLCDSLTKVTAAFHDGEQTYIFDQVSIVLITIATAIMSSSPHLQPYFQVHMKNQYPNCSLPFQSNHLCIIDHGLDIKYIQKAANVFAVIPGTTTAAFYLNKLKIVYLYNGSHFYIGEQKGYEPDNKIRWNFKTRNTRLEWKSHEFLNTAKSIFTTKSFVFFVGPKFYYRIPKSCFSEQVRLNMIRLANPLLIASDYRIIESSFPEVIARLQIIL